MRVLFKIPKENPPALKDRRKWSTQFHDFLARGLQKNQHLRPDARTLLEVIFYAATINFI